MTASRPSLRVVPVDEDEIVDRHTLACAVWNSDDECDCSGVAPVVAAYRGESA